MLKRIVLYGLCAAVLTTAGWVYAQDVYVTKNGKKYHKAECRLIQKKNPEAITLDEAKTSGLEPCRKCYKDELSAAASDDAPQVSSVKKSSKRAK